jgi:hypothetical protein
MQKIHFHGPSKYIHLVTKFFKCTSQDHPYINHTGYEYIYKDIQIGSNKLLKYLNSPPPPPPLPNCPREIHLSRPTCSA